MDKNHFLQLLKNLQSVMRCPSCGAVYTVEEMQFMGNHDGYFLLSMTCTECNLPVWVNFFAGPNQKEGMTLTDLTINDFDLAQKDPITQDEVISFHNFIATFNGDFKGKFRHLG
jgi:hypothetical protein